MMLFLIFLFVDLSVVGIFYAVYGRRRTYSEGMLMGVHLPESAASGEEVGRMMEQYHVRTKKFYLWNLAGVSVCHRVDGLAPGDVHRSLSPSL